MESFVAANCVLSISSFETAVEDAGLGRNVKLGLARCDFVCEQVDLLIHNNASRKQSPRTNSCEKRCGDHSRVS